MRNLLFKHNNEIVGYIDGSATFTDVEKLRNIISEELEISSDELEIFIEEVNINSLLSFISISPTGQLIYDDLSCMPIIGIEMTSDLSDSNNIDNLLDNINENKVYDFLAFMI